MESVSERIEHNTPDDKFSSRVLNERPATEEPEKTMEGVNEHAGDSTLETVAELNDQTVGIHENGREKRPKLENLPDTEDQQTVGVNSICGGNEGDTVTSEVNTNHLKPEDDRSKENQEISENKLTQPEVIKDMHIQTMDLVSQETGEIEADFQAIDNAVGLTDNAQEKLGEDDKAQGVGEDDKAQRVVVSEAGTNEALDAAETAAEGGNQDVQSADGKGIMEGAPKSAGKPTEGPEADGAEEEPSVQERVEDKEVGQQSAVSEITRAIIEEPGTDEVEQVSESRSTKKTERSALTGGAEDLALGSQAEAAATKVELERKETAQEVLIKTEPQAPATSQPSEPHPVLIPSININSENTENKGEMNAFPKTETILSHEPDNEKENDTDSGTGSTVENSSSDLNLSISSFLSKTKDSGSMSLQVSMPGALLGFCFAILVISISLLS